MFMFYMCPLYAPCFFRFISIESNWQRITQTTIAFPPQNPRIRKLLPVLQRIVTNRKQKDTNIGNPFKTQSVKTYEYDVE